jgi:hypothetical protein
MSLLARLLTFLGLAREADAAGTAPAPASPVPVPGVYRSAQGVPVYAVGEAPPPPANSSNL